VSVSTELILRLLEATPGWAGQAAEHGLDSGDARLLLTEAARLADDLLDPLGARADREGCRIEGGRVRVPEGYAEAYARLGTDGWIAPDLAPELGGQGLPLALQTAVAMLFDGAAAPFMMAAGASRAAAHLLVAHVPELAADWAPALAAGERTATICISEPDAGSDVGRIRTRATPDATGWRIDGTKCWISFGDHNMTPMIGHLLLARTGPPEVGTRGLSLFLVPNRTPEGMSNGITVERIEEKLGLHGSPTCVLRFGGACATLIGAEGRGLPQLFRMIELMRLQVAGQGAAIALRAAAVAHGYAADRAQGGDPACPPVPIATHPDVRRQLAALDAEAAVLTALALEVAVELHAARAGCPEAAHRAAFLLPLAKTFAGEGAFAAASGAIQVLGGAGYTRDWAAERLLRDARILTIYEGTTGMQAQDFLLRRLIRDEGRGLAAYAARLLTGLAAAPSPEADSVAALLSRLEDLALSVRDRSGEDLLVAADGFFRAGWAVVSAAIAHRIGISVPTHAAKARVFLALAPERFALAESACRLRAIDLD
jgi:alkylation response protein AidB-like acyl-CoA dehydrogenase